MQLDYLVINENKKKNSPTNSVFSFKIAKVYINNTPCHAMFKVTYYPGL